MADVLGADYSAEQLDLAGGDFATLVSLPPKGEARGAILYVHGFVDYFFQDHVARHFSEQGWAWYAIDLRRCGRSLRAGQEPWYSDDITEFYEEIALAIDRIHSAGYEKIVLMGHSTGALVAALWANDQVGTRTVDALILNSPWLDLQKPWIMRTVGTVVIRAVGKFFPLMNAPEKLGGLYPQSVHKSAYGEWDFDPRWKPLTPQDVKMGFLGSVRKEQARLHKGLNLDIPVLMLRSAKSRLYLEGWNEDASSADTVLDVRQMEKWAPQLGADVTDVPLEGAVHDVMLSAQPIRDKAMTTIDEWLVARLS